MDGKKFFLFFSLFLSFILVFNFELIFDNEYENRIIEELYQRKIISVESRTYPIRVDRLLRELKESRKRTDLSKEEIFLIEKLILRFEKKKGIFKYHFDFNNILDIKKFSDSTLIKDSVITYTNLLIKNSKNNLFYHISFDLFFPFVERDSFYYRMRDWKKTGSDFNNTFFGIYSRDYFFIFGRVKPSWGGGFYDNIYFSKNLLPLDGILLEYDFKKVKFFYFTAYMTPYYLRDKKRTDNTYMSTHRLQFLPNKNINFSFKEMMIYQSNLPQPPYLNPLIFYYIIQNNSFSDDNIIWSFDLSFENIYGFKIYNELFIDDYQYDPEFIYVPNKLGYLFSAIYSRNRFIAGIEYCIINTYTGTHEFDRLNYTYYRRPISYFFGTDGDFFVFKLDYRMNEIMKCGYNLSLLRKGSRDLFDSWEEEMPLTQPPFPSGKVELTFKNGISFYGEFFKEKIFLDFDINHLYIKNYKNILGVNANDFEVNFKLGVNL